MKPGLLRFAVALAFTLALATVASAQDAEDPPTDPIEDAPADDGEGDGVDEAEPEDEPAPEGEEPEATDDEAADDELDDEAADDDEGEGSDGEGEELSAIDEVEPAAELEEGEDEGPLFPEEGTLMDLLEDADEDLEISGVVVRATPDEIFRTGGSVHTIGEEDLERFNYDDPHSILMQMPGVYVRQEDGYGLRPNIGLRGGSAERSARVTLMEDGVLFGPAPYAAPAAYFFPLLTRVVGVEAFMGPAAIPYGPHTVGGALNLLNRDIPREATGGVDLAAGANYYGRMHLHFGASNEWGGFLVEGVYLRSDGFRNLDYAGRDDNTGFDRGEIVVRGDVRGTLAPGIYHRLEGRVGLSLEGSNETYLGLTDEDFAENPDRRYGASSLDRMEYWRTQAQLRHRLDVGEDFSLHTVAYRHDMDRAWRKLNAFGGLHDTETGGQARVSLYDVLTNPRGRNAVYAAILSGQEDTTGSANDYLLIGTNARTYVSQGIQSEGHLRWLTGPLTHRIRVGARLHFDEVSRDHREEAFAQQGQQLTLAQEEYTLLQNRAEALAFSAHAAWGVTWENLTVTPGVRMELIWTRLTETLPDPRDLAGFQAEVLPGIGAQYAILPEWAVFAGVHRGFSPVGPGQPDEVRPEESVNYELGTRARITETRTEGQLTFFLNDYSNLVGVCMFAGGCTDDMVGDQFNGGAVIVAGLEASVSQTFEVDDLTIPLRAAYTFTFTEFQTSFDSSNPQFGRVQAGYHLPYVPEHQLSVQAGAEMRDWGVNVSGVFVSEMWEAAGRVDPDRGPTAPQTDAMFMLDAMAWVRIAEPAQLYVRGENLTFSRALASRRPFGARPVRPFQVQVGLRLQI